MKKEIKKSSYEEYMSIAKSVTHSFISIILFVLPLAITNGYYNITETKLWAFYLISGGYIVIQLFLFVAFAIINGKVFLKSLSFKFEFIDVAFILFGLSYIISAATSQYGANDVVFGIGSRYQGALTITLYVLLYFVITRTFSFSPKCLVWAGISFTIVSVIAVLNGFSVDPLGIYSELSSENKGLYISTIGNVNFYSAYYNIILPPLVVGFCNATDKKTLVVFGIFLLAGALGMVCTASESFLLGFVVAMLLLLLFLMNDKQALKRFIISCYLFIFTLTAYTNLYNSGVVKDGLNFAPSGLMVILSKPVIVGLLVVLLTFVLIISKLKPKSMPKIKNVYGILLVVGFVCSVVAIILVNTSFKNVDLGELNNYLKFSAKWGTNRGQNWMFCVNEFASAPIISKLFGFGPETYYHLTEKTGFYVTKSLDQAHNEYLQYLISVGLLGLGAYACVLFDTIKNSIRSIEKNPVAESLLCGLIAYWIQATVNIAQPFTTPILFVFIAVLSNLNSV